MANSTFSLGKIYQDLANGNLLKMLARHSDLLFPVGVMLAIGTFFYLDSDLFDFGLDRS